MPSPGSPFRIGTRGSPLALAQADEVRLRLAAAHPALREPGAVEIVTIRTTGDRVLDRPLAEIGGKGLFTKEIEEALAAGTIDVAVHSMKDVPTVLPDGLVIDCVLPREDPHDAFFAAGGGGLASLPAGAVVGTASLRRQAQLLYARPDLGVVPLRGNVGTRLGKLEAGLVDATILAVAGLRRLGEGARITHVLAAETMLPAVAQGAIGLERRVGDEATAALLAALDDPGSHSEVTAERALLTVLDGSCRTPIAALARQSGGRISLTGLVALPDGRQRHVVTLDGEAMDAARIGREAGLELKRLAGPEFLSAAAAGTAA
ncbi:MAG TPA: hydroxymethylbilane synthase [Stellaceae bacterium]|nr:hydroxymethylbilane synthase [Stellaceae bacterium]